MSPNKHTSPNPELSGLRERLMELEGTLLAIRAGQVEVMINDHNGPTTESAESSSHRFRGQVLQHISESVVAVDNEGMTIYLNEAAERQYGRRASEVMGLPLSALYQYSWGDSAEEQVARTALRTHGHWQGENKQVKLNGEVLHMESVVNTLRNTKGERIGLLAVMRDISQRVKDREALAEGERQKDHFLATLAHELRNPLAPLMNGLQLLDGDALDPDTLSATQAMMQRQLDQLVRLVDDLMDLGRISRGKLELQKEELDLADVLSVAMETSRSIIDRRDHQLIVDVVSGPFPVFGDATRLAQILANLLNNAAKYTPCGGVITVSMRADQSQVDVRVCDTGIGIAPDQLDRIFDMFAQVEGPSSDAGGLGIGLNLSQRLAHLHRGELMATSDGLDQGSCFTLQLPLANAEPVVPIVAEMPDATLPDALRILVVDDNEDVATTTVMLLSKLGQRAQAAFNGAQAIRTGAELQPHLVLMDLGMPGLSGHETCAQMRATAWGRDIKIVAISGWGQESDRAKSRDAGFDEHFVKPMELRSIKRLLRELTGATDQHSHD